MLRQFKSILQLTYFLINYIYIVNITFKLFNIHRDEDMQSLASLLSVNNNSDIAVLEDLDEDDYTLSDSSTRQVSDWILIKGLNYEIFIIYMIYLNRILLIKKIELLKTI